MNFWDRFIGFFSAKEEFRRSRFRTATELVRKYEGAGRGRRTKNWRTSGASANAENETAIKTLRNRARDLVRNNPYAQNGVQAITKGMIGDKGIFAQVKVDGAAGRQDQVSQIWKAWSETKGVADYDGVHDFAGIQRLVSRALVESGEIFIRRRRTRRRTVRTTDGFAVEVPPFSLQLLESDFLDVNSGITTFPQTGNDVIQGIEFDKSGKRVAYHFYKEHPGNASSQIGTLKTAFETVRIPADEVLHVFRADRPGQIRGVSWFAPVMMRLRDLDEYEDAQLVRQKIAACFTVFVRDIDGFDNTMEPTEGELGEKVEPGIIETLPPGKSIELANPPTVENYAEYTQVNLRGIASGLGLTYESLVHDLSQVNFSSGRMGKIEERKNFSSWREQIFIPQFLDPSFMWFLEGLALIGVSSARVRSVYTAPRMELIDPQKEIQAMKEGVRSGFFTQSEALRSLGSDPEQVMTEKAQDDSRLDELGIVLDTDPRKDANRLAPAQTSAPQNENS